MLEDNITQRACSNIFIFIARRPGHRATSTWHLSISQMEKRLKCTRSKNGLNFGWRVLLLWYLEDCAAAYPSSYFAENVHLTMQIIGGKFCCKQHCSQAKVFTTNSQSHLRSRQVLQKYSATSSTRSDSEDATTDLRVRKWRTHKPTFGLHSFPLLMQPL